MIPTLRRPRPARPTRRRARLAGATLALGAAAALLAPVAAAAPLPAAPLSAAPLSAAPLAVGGPGPCADPDGVTVVVDATELGGDLTVACAADPATGTEALAQAGFTEARDPSGYLCAIGGLPDPCPTEFTGSYWTYWFAAPDGEWTAYTEGSDTAVPEPGAVEGWRYGDGTQPPGVEPADVAPGTGSAEAGDAEDGDDGAADAPADEATDEPTAEATEGAAAPEDDAGSALPRAAALVGGVAILGALVAVLVRARRGSGAQD